MEYMFTWLKGTVDVILFSFVKFYVRFTTIYIFREPQLKIINFKICEHHHFYKGLKVVNRVCYFLKGGSLEITSIVPLT